MANRYKSTGAGTKIEIYPQHDCLSRTPAPVSIATTGAVADAGDTTITVAFSPALTKPILAPMWATATDPATGKEVDFKITADVAIGATSLTVVALANDIPSGSLITFPVTFPGRSSCNWQPSNQSDAMQTLDEAGWESSTPTTKGGSFQLGVF
jgi:hypothetical protein